MFKHTMPAAATVTTVSTPEVWAKVFANATKFNAWRRFRFHMTKEWSLIARYVPRGGRILDAGCGAGDWVTFLRTRGYDAEGIDYSTAIVNRVRATYPSARWTIGDIREMPFEAGRFDGVISWGVIEHDEAGPGAALREIRRVLKAGGIAIVTVPLDSKAARRAAQLQMDAARPAAFFQYLMSPGELVEHLVSHGFEPIEHGTLPVVLVNLVFPRLARRLHGFPFRVANALFATLLPWMKHYRSMTYCVARKGGNGS